MARTNVTPMRKRRRKVGLPEHVPTDQEQCKMDLQIGLALLSAERHEQFCSYLQVRHTQTNWGLSTQAA